MEGRQPMVIKIIAEEVARTHLSKIIQYLLETRTIYERLFIEQTSSTVTLL